MTSILLPQRTGYTLPPKTRSIFRRRIEQQRRRLASGMAPRHARGYDNGPALECHLSPEDPELELAWDRLRYLTGDQSDRNPDSVACWHYLGSFHDEPESVGHRFCHHNRPTSARPIHGVPRSCGRVYVTIPASAEYLTSLVLDNGRTLADPLGIPSDQPNFGAVVDFVVVHPEVHSAVRSSLGAIGKAGGDVLSFIRHIARGDRPGRHSRLSSFDVESATLADNTRQRRLSMVRSIRRQRMADRMEAAALAEQTRRHRATITRADALHRKNARLSAA